MPPQVIVQSAPASRSFTRAIFTTLATTIFGVSLALNLYLLLWSGLMAGGSSGTVSRQEVVIAGDVKQKVVVIGVKGVITGATFKRFDEMIAQAEEDKDLKALVIDIDTPGGAVTASDQIHNRIQKFKAKIAGSGRTVPVVATIGALGTSGGYYVACAADYVFTEPTGLTGNIGVILPRFNVSKLVEKYGIEETTIASTGATYKNAGSMFKPENERDTAYIQKIADDAFASFKSVVATGRKGKLKAPMAEVADGRAFLAADALKMGLIDEVGTASDAYAYVAKQVGLGKPHVVRYEPPASLMEALLGGGAESMGNVSVGYVNGELRLGADAVNELLTPRLLYLWRAN
jgi:protease-4